MKTLRNKINMEGVFSIKRMRAADEVFDVLHEWILSGKLKPGDRLPSQDRLAEQFGVSRNTLREAIYKLDVMGLLDTKQGVGTVVGSATTSSYLSPLAEHLLLNPATVYEFLETRIIVERATARLAAIRATPEEIAQIMRIITLQVEASESGDIDKFSKLDSDYHLALAGACKNSVLTKLLETIREMLNIFIREVAQFPGSVKNAITFHGRILACIKSKDAEGAEKEMVRHLYDVVETIEKSLDLGLDAKSLFYSTSSGTKF